MDLRPELSLLPLRMRGLPLHRGYPVPWFVASVDGVPDFRVMDAGKFARAIREKRCWVCGDVLGRYFAFVIGPMCAITRTTSEPPCHQECARWSAINCPFLSRPHMHRRDGDVPSDAAPAAGIPIDRNPGVACVWTTRDYERFSPPTGGHLLRVGNPTEVQWFAEGRYATRAEVAASILSGFPALVESTMLEPPERRALALDALRSRHQDVKQLWPAA
jgi:hypothetical protein